MTLSFVDTLRLGMSISTVDAQLEDIQVGQVLAINAENRVLVVIRESGTSRVCLYDCVVPTTSPYVLMRAHKCAVNLQGMSLRPAEIVLSTWGFNLIDPTVLDYLLKDVRQTSKTTLRIQAYLDENSRGSRMRNLNEDLVTLHIARAHKLLNFVFDLTEELITEDVRPELRAAFIRGDLDQVGLLDPSGKDAWKALRMRYDQEFYSSFLGSSMVHAHAARLQITHPPFGKDPEGSEKTRTVSQMTAKIENLIEFITNADPLANRATVLFRAQTDMIVEFVVENAPSLLAPFILGQKEAIESLDPENAPAWNELRLLYGQQMTKMHAAYKKREHP